MTEPAKTCAWCDEIAVATVTVQPARTRTVGKGDQRRDELVSMPIIAPACEVHRHITADQPAHIEALRRRHAAGGGQATVFDIPDISPGNALYGNEAA